MEENIIHLNGTDVYVTENPKDAYSVKSGSVCVYIAPTANRKRDKNVPVCIVEAGKTIPSLAYLDSGHTKWNFIISPQGDAELQCMPGMATSVLRKKFLANSGKTFSAEESFEGALVEYYTRELIKDSVFIGRGIKEEPQIHAEIFENIEGAVKQNAEQIVGSDSIYKVTAFACRSLKIEVLAEEKLLSVCNEPFTLPEIAKASGFGYRSVVLDENWYKKDCGTFVGKVEDRPVALVCRRHNEYTIYYGDTGETLPVDEKIAETVNPQVYGITKVLPHGSVNKKTLFKFAFGCVNRSDLILVLILGLVGGLIGILVPRLNQLIYDDYIPLGNYGELAQICAIIATFMLGSMFFDMVKSLCESRIGSRVGYSLQDAIFYRVFRLPESFMRKYESADMAQRLFSVSNLSSTYISAILVSGIGGVYSLLYLFKMFKYAKKLAWFGLALLAAYAAVTFLISKLALRHSTKVQELSGEASGKMYQYVSGVDKLRMAGAEDRAIHQYLKTFSEVQSEAANEDKFESINGALQAVIATVFSIIFYIVTVKSKLELSSGNFTAFNSAFGSFSASMLQLTSSVISLHLLKPVYERIRPVFETPEEDTEGCEFPGKLEGRITLENVRFSYDSDSPNVLDGISLDVKKGEYLGIVGPSGCGKSTLLKLLLGFETPKEGCVRYDGMDFRGLEKREVRKNLGVVLQNGQLISGSIMENITITSPNSTLKDVEAVVEAVGLKHDIEQMPMGLQTVLSEGSGTISGGQKQRILIARAIINNPAILLFDEATSALDNITQAQVCESLDKLHSTRIVVAHRLSTIKNCDRIIVLDKGKIQEEGNYATLMAKKGMFYNLAIRQIADAGEEE